MGVLGGCGAILEDFFGDIGAKLVDVWAPFGAFWRPSGVQEVILGSSWASFGGFWEHFAQIWGIFLVTFFDSVLVWWFSCILKPLPSKMLGLGGHRYRKMIQKWSPNRRKID